MASPSTTTIKTTSTLSAVPSLTTTFTPAASCLTDLYVYSVVSGGSLWDYRQLGPSPTASDCFPSHFSAIPSAYFSPGICPTYYSIACSTVVNIGTVTETRATCCPSAYSCQLDKTGWPWYSTELCTFQGSVTSTFLFTASESISTATGLANLNAYGMEVRWQASDTSPPSTTASSTLSTSVSASPASTAVSTSLPTSTPTSSASPSSASTSSLSTGAKAGIGIGAAVAALLILTGIVFFFIRRRRSYVAANTQDPTQFTPGQLQQQQYYVEAAAGDVQSKAPFHELPAQGREKAPVELSSESWR